MGKLKLEVGQSLTTISGLPAKVVAENPFGFEVETEGVVYFYTENGTWKRNNPKPPRGCVDGSPQYYDAIEDLDPLDIAGGYLHQKLAE